MSNTTIQDGFDLARYLSGGVENIVKRVIRATLKDPKESAFMMQYALASKEASRKRAAAEEERDFLSSQLMAIREEYPEMLFISFPGDEKRTGGCLAAGRGFFHINSHGGAEPCPFSPYSDINVRDTSLKEALRSRLFQALQNEDMLTGEHIGGCVLFEQRSRVEAILGKDNWR